MVYERGCKGNAFQWTGSIIYKTFWRPDEALVHKQWDLERGREREGRGREGERVNGKVTVSSPSGMAVPSTTHAFFPRKRK